MKIIHTEYQDQCNIVEYLEILKKQRKITKFTAINPQPGKLTMPQADRMKKAGLRAGFPDLIIIADKRMLCLEMKRIKDGRLDLEQGEWMGILYMIPGVISYVAYGYDEAKRIIDDFIRVE